MNSLSRRLQLGLFLSLALLSALLLWAGNGIVYALIESYVISRLEHDAESLLAVYGDSRRGGIAPGMRSRRMTQVYQQPYSGHYYQFDSGQAAPLRSRSLWDHSLQVPALAAGTTQVSRQAGPDGQQLLVWSGGFEKRGETLTLTVAEDISGINDQIRTYRLRFGLGILAAALVLLLVQQLIVRLTLRRLDRLRLDIRQLEKGEISTLDESVPDEVQPLVREFNRLLALLGSRLERSRNALGNLAHAIKTPLNLLVQMLDQGDLQSPSARRSLLEQTERIRTLTERELRRARLAGAGAAGQWFQPAEDVPALVDTLQHIHRERRVAIQCVDCPVEAFALDREDLLELLGNLLDNACKWAAGLVRLYLVPESGQLAIRIEDDGPGVAPSALHALTRRGARLDESVDGHGLGLAVVSDIVSLYGGQLAFGRSEALGGLRVDLSLPLAAPSPPATGT